MGTSTLRGAETVQDQEKEVREVMLLSRAGEDEVGKQEAKGLVEAS